MWRIHCGQSLARRSTALPYHHTASPFLAQHYASAARATAPVAKSTSSSNNKSNNSSKSTSTIKPNKSKDNKKAAAAASSSTTKKEKKKKKKVAQLSTASKPTKRRQRGVYFTAIDCTAPRLEAIRDAKFTVALAVFKRHYERPILEAYAKHCEERKQQAKAKSKAQRLADKGKRKELTDPEMRTRASFRQFLQERATSYPSVAHVTDHEQTVSEELEEKLDEVFALNKADFATPSDYNREIMKIIWGDYYNDSPLLGNNLRQFLPYIPELDHNRRDPDSWDSEISDRGKSQNFESALFRGYNYDEGVPAMERNRPRGLFESDAWADDDEEDGDEEREIEAALQEREENRRKAEVEAKEYDGWGQTEETLSDALENKSQDTAFWGSDDDDDSQQNTMKTGSERDTAKEEGGEEDKYEDEDNEEGGEYYGEEVDDGEYIMENQGGKNEGSKSKRQLSTNDVKPNALQAMMFMLNEIRNNRIDFEHMTPHMAGFVVLKEHLDELPYRERRFLQREVKAQYKMNSEYSRAKTIHHLQSKLAEYKLLDHDTVNLEYPQIVAPQRRYTFRGGDIETFEAVHNIMNDVRADFRALFPKVIPKPLPVGTHTHAVQFISTRSFDAVHALSPLKRTAFRHRKVIMKVDVSQLGVSDAVVEHLKRLAGTRYNPATHTLTLVADKQPNKVANKQLVIRTFQELMNEALQADPNYVPLADLNVGRKRAALAELIPRTQLPEDLKAELKTMIDWRERGETALPDVNWTDMRVRGAGGLGWPVQGVNGVKYNSKSYNDAVRTVTKESPIYMRDPPVGVMRYIPGDPYTPMKKLLGRERKGPSPLRPGSRKSLALDAARKSAERRLVRMREEDARAARALARGGDGALDDEEISADALKEAEEALKKAEAGEDEGMGRKNLTGEAIIGPLKLGVFNDNPPALSEIAEATRARKDMGWRLFRFTTLHTQQRHKHHGTVDAIFAEQLRQQQQQHAEQAQ